MKPRISFEDLAIILVIAIVFVVATLLAQDMVVNFVDSLQ